MTRLRTVAYIQIRLFEINILPLKCGVNFIVRSILQNYISKQMPNAQNLT